MLYAARMRLTEEDYHKYKHLVYWVANRKRGPIEIQEAVSLGMLGLVQAAHSFNAESRNKFTSYAIKRIGGAILDERRRQGEFPRRTNTYLRPYVCSLDRLKEEHDIDVEDLFCEEPSFVDAALLRKLLRRLTPREREVFYLTYALEYNRKEVAAFCGFSESRTCQYIKRAMRKLRGGREV